MPRSAGRNTLGILLTGSYALCPNLEDVQLAARQKKAVLAFSELVFSCLSRFSPVAALSLNFLVNQRRRKQIIWVAAAATHFS
jgi:hypothetical protein